MHTFKLKSEHCEQCTGYCRIVRCPHCNKISYVNEWECFANVCDLGHDHGDIGICPMCEQRIVGGWEPMPGNDILCRLEAMAAADEEERKGRKGRKVKR